MIPAIELDPNLVRQALDEALVRFPQFAPYPATLIGRPIFQGVAYQLVWERQPPQEIPHAWEFQNAAVKAYQRLSKS